MTHPNTSMQSEAPAHPRSFLYFGNNLYGNCVRDLASTSAYNFLCRGFRASSFRAPKPLPIYRNFKLFVPKSGFPVVEGLKSSTKSSSGPKVEGLWLGGRVEAGALLKTNVWFSLACVCSAFCLALLHGWPNLLTIIELAMKKKKAIAGGSNGRSQKPS